MSVKSDDKASAASTTVKQPYTPPLLQEWGSLADIGKSKDAASRGRLALAKRLDRSDG